MIYHHLKDQSSLYQREAELTGFLYRQRLELLQEVQASLPVTCFLGADKFPEHFNKAQEEINDRAQTAQYGSEWSAKTTRSRLKRRISKWKLVLLCTFFLALGES